MNTTQRSGIMQRWNIIQHELMPELRNEVGALTPKLVKLVHTLEWVRIEEFVSSTWGGCGRPEHDRGMLANAFVAKAVLGLSTTAGLIERLTMDRALKRICGFSMWHKLPSEATFSRAFAEFAEAGLAERTHAALVKETLGEQLIGHISRDGTAIEAREKPAKREKAPESTDDAFTQIVSQVHSLGSVVGFENLSEGTYWLRLRAIDSNGLQGGEAKATFTIESSRPHVEKSASSIEEAEDVTLPIITPLVPIMNNDEFLTGWNSVSGYWYQLQVSDTANFAKSIRDVTTKENYFGQAILPKGKYFLRLRLIDNKNQTGSWCEPVKFLIE